jgi:diacylglycerol O-acyltransferase / wax synthase
MKRLSATDSSFLSLETSVTPMRVGGLVTLDTTDAPDFGFERVRELYAGRIPRVPKLTWKLKQVPFHLDRPLWVDGGVLDIDQHLERIVVPSPGGPREVAAVVGDLFTRPLDRHLPLWRMWYLDGLPDGTAALFSTHHHCLMDGTSGVAISSIMFDLEPNPGPDPEHLPVGPGGRDLSDVEQLLRSGLNMMAASVKLPRFVGACAGRVAHLAPDMLKHGVPAAMRSPAPRTSFNYTAGARRGLSFASICLADVKSVRKRLGVTVNDVIVAICTAALERYLHEIGEAVPERPLAVAVAVSTRTSDDRELTNRVSFMPIAVATDVADPAERVRAISREAEQGKRLTDTFKARRLPSVGELLPPIAFGAAMRAMTPLFPLMPVVINTMVSTVRGAPFPLYVAGARVTGVYPTSVVMFNMGINFTAISSEDQVDIGVTVDPDLVPDAWLVANAIPTALEELMHAAGLGDPRPVPLFAVT